MANVAGETKQLFGEAVLLFIASYAVGFLLFTLCFGVVSAMEGTGGSLIGRTVSNILLLFFFAIIPATLALLPAALGFVPAFVGLFSFLIRLVPPPVADAMAAMGAGALGMLVAQHVVFDTGPPFVSFETEDRFNLVPNAAGLVWIAVVSSAIMSAVVKPGRNFSKQ